MTLRYHILFLILLISTLTVATKLSSQELLSSNLTRTIKGDQLLYAGIGFVNPEAFTFNIFAANGGGSPTVSSNINYQYALHDRFLLGGFASFYRVNADYQTSYDELASLFDEPTFEELLTNFDCIVLGNCSTTISERISVYTLGIKASYTKRIVKKLETYMSGYLGYSFNRRKTITESALDLISTELELGVEVPRVIYFSSAGFRYYFSTRWALQGEIGFGNSHLINIGANYKLY